MLWSDDGESNHLEGPVGSNKRPKRKTATPNIRKTINRESSNDAEHTRFTVRCRFNGNCLNRFECVAAMEYHGENFHSKVAEREQNCHLCGWKAPNKHHLQTHINAKHLGRKPFHCPYPDCTRTFSQKSNRTKHVNGVHTQRNKFDCTIRHKKCFRKNLLERHMAQAHGEVIQYFCYLCREQLFNKKYLQKHFKLKHIGQSPYKCNVANCSQVCSTKYDLDVHKNGNHTQKRVFNCTRCSFKSYYRKNLIKHLRKKNGKTCISF